jgi:hypothetical protein
VDPGTQWRLYAVYKASHLPEAAEVEDGQTLGLPGTTYPSLIPVTATDGQQGWARFDLITDQGAVRLVRGPGRAGAGPRLRTGRHDTDRRG